MTRLGIKIEYKKDKTSVKQMTEDLTQKMKSKYHYKCSIGNSCRDVRKQESLFGIGFRKPDRVNRRQKSKPRVWFPRHWKAEIKQPQFFHCLFINRVILMIKLYITDDYVFDSLCMVTSRHYSKASNR